MSRKLKLVLLLLLIAVPAFAQYLGAEIYRRTVAPSVIRVYSGPTLLSETHVPQGDLRVTYALDVPPVVTVTGFTVPPALEAGQSGTGVVTVTPAASLARSIAITVSNSNALLVPGSVSLPAGETTAQVPLQARPAVTTPTAVTLRATLGTSSKVASLTVNPVKPPEPDPGPGPGPNPTEGWFVSPDGKPTNAGTAASPWDIESTVNGTRRSALAGGGTVWLLPGTYRKSPNPEGLGFRCVVGGTADRPLVFRALPGQRSILDGGWAFIGGAANCWLWGVEIIVSEPKPHGSSGSWPEGCPTGGVTAYGSQNCKAINVICHDNRQGFSLWNEAKDFEAYGCISYDNGWVGTDRAHGHDFYTQNGPGSTRWITDCLVTSDASAGWRDGRYTLHCYASSVPAVNTIVTGWIQVHRRDALIMVPGTAPASEGNRFDQGYLSGQRFQVYGTAQAPTSILNSSLIGVTLDPAPPPPPAVVQEGNYTAFSAPVSFVRINRYDPNRAHLVAYDPQRRGKVHVDLSGFVTPGSRLSVMSPTRFYGQPVWTGAYPAEGLDLPVPSGDTAAAYVLLKETAPPGARLTSGARVVEEAPLPKKSRKR